MQKNIIGKLNPTIINGFIPINNAKQFTEVKVFDSNKLKFQIKRESFSAQDLINA